MTLHITYGFVLRGPAADLFALPSTIRATLVPVADTLVYDLLGRYVAEHVDRTRAGLPVHPDHGEVPATWKLSVLALARRTAEREIEAASNDAVHRSPQFDLSARVQVLAHPDEPGAVLMILRAERADVYAPALAELDGFEDFSYYSCEHPPIPRKAWEARQDVWAAALNGPRFLSDLAWSWDLLDRHPHLTLPSLHETDVATVLAHVPEDTFRRRRLSLAQVVLPQDFIEANLGRWATIAEAELAAAADLDDASAKFVRDLSADDLLVPALP